MAESPLTQAIRQTLFKVNPTLREPLAAFNPEGTGFDYDTAIKYGLRRGPDDHWGSRVELPPELTATLGLPLGSGIMLKGASHPTWDKALMGEAQAGFQVIKGRDGRYYSIPR